MAEQSSTRRGGGRSNQLTVTCGRIDAHQHGCAPRSLIEPLEPRRLYASTLDVFGALAVSLDQPRINAFFRTTPDGEPLVGGDETFGTFNVEAFLDTGASGILLSQETAAGLGIEPTTRNGEPVVFSDIGVAGGEPFYVSDPLYAALAPFNPAADIDNPATYDTVYDQSIGPVRTQINQTESDFGTGPLDIVGMPALQGKVTVMDPRLLNSGELETMRTYVYDPGTPFDAAGAAADTDPGIPRVERHVKLSYGDFSRFTETTPAGAPGPTLAKNPFIGPNPVNALTPGAPADNTPGVAIAEGTKARTGSFLLDTGAAASFISRDMAAAVGVTYAPGTYGSDNPTLVYANGQVVENQFQLTIGGIGGAIDAAGFYLDHLDLPTAEGPIRFHDAPVIVLDVTVEDPVSGQTLTLDGDFGMNFLVASASIVDGFPDDISAGAFDWITFDQPNGILGLSPTGAGVTGMTVNDGAAQRSMVKSLTVTFDRPVSLDAGAFTLAGRGGAGAGTSLVVTNPSGDDRTFVLTFTGAPVTGGSLADGVYDLTVAAAKVHDQDPAGPAMTADAAFAFHRLYSDVNGDGDSDNGDAALLRGTYNKVLGNTGFLSSFDYNGDGDVDAGDAVQVRSRRAIEYKGY